MPNLNLVLLKAPPLSVPYVLDDALSSVCQLLTRAGFDTAITLNKIDNHRINILFGLQMPNTAGLAQVRKVASNRNTIIFNTEQLGGESHWISEEYLSMLGDYVTLDYNIHNLHHLQSRFRDARCLEFPLIPDSRFRYDFNLAETAHSIHYDLAFYGSSGLGGRLEKLQGIANRGLRIKCFSGAFGEYLAPQLVDCAAVLNIHGFSSAIFETIRCLRPAALGIPIISETSRHSEIASWSNSGVIFVDENNLSEGIAKIFENPYSLLSASRKLRSFVDDPKWPGTAASVMHKAFALLEQPL